MARRCATAAAIGLAAAVLTAGHASAQVTWQPFQSAPGVVDLAGPRSDGRLVTAVAGGLQLFGGAGLIPFTHAAGPGAYAPPADEAYIALSAKARIPKSHCSFHRDDLFALANNPSRVIRIRRSGNASEFATLPTPFLGAIAFDRVGSFGHRLLVIGTANNRSTLFAVDCRGRVRAIVRNGPHIEGGIAVAPRSFGPFGGRLIGLDETAGPIYAFKPGGSVGVVETPSLPSGPDTGVEALGFVPKLRASGAAFLSDRGVGPAFPHPGTDSILRLTAGELASAGVRAGDLLVATEASALTVAVRRRARGGTVRQIGTGPTVTHAEGHIAFLGTRR